MTRRYYKCTKRDELTGTLIEVSDDSEEVATYILRLVLLLPEMMIVLGAARDALPNRGANDELWGRINAVLRAATET